LCICLKDRFGYIWRVVPKVLQETMELGDEGQTIWVIEAKLKTGRCDIKGLKKAFEGR